MQRYFARKGDKTTANGTVLEGEESFIQDGLPVAFHGARVYCPACNSTGVIFTIPPHHLWTVNGKQLALDGDLCICKCSPSPRLLASQSSALMSFDGNSDATSTPNGANTGELLGVAIAGLASMAKASSDADYERMRQEAYGDPRFWTAQVGPASPDAATANSPERNVRAFLRLVRYAEHNKDDDSAYSTLYGGGRFTNYANHPNQKVVKWGHASTAAGAYQILYGTWKEAKDRGLVNDFSPASQDVIAREKLRTRGALSDVEAGDIERAIPRLRKEWTSLPGASQSTMTMQDARVRFDRYVAEER